MFKINLNVTSKNNNRMDCEVFFKRKFNLFDFNSPVLELCIKVGGISKSNLVFTMQACLE